MEQMKELLKERIAQIQDPVQKILLQDVLADVFSELLEYSESCFSRLEEKINGEIQLPGFAYDIYTGVCKKDGLDTASRCLYAADQGTLDEETLDEKTLDEKTLHQEKQADYLGTMFLACKYPDVLKCMKEHHQAQVETDMGVYRTAVGLTYSRSYLQTFGWLYRQFGANQRQWHTVNCPFLYKMLDILDVEGTVPKEASVAKIAIDLGGLSDYVMNDTVLVWNLSKEEYRVRAKMGAAGSNSFYEHQIPIKDKESGYLAVLEKEEPFTAVFSKDGLCIRTEHTAQGSLELLKFNRIDMQKDQTALLFPLQTNHRSLRHADRQAFGHPGILWTKGEVTRILNTYEPFQDFELVDICPDVPGEIKSIDMNPFIQTHSMLKEKRKIALVLHPKDSSDIFQYEKMFFLLAELQLCTEEYEWTGIIRE